MAFKPNYNLARSERDRAKREKKEEKLKKRQEKTAQRKAEREGTTSEANDKTDG